MMSTVADGLSIHRKDLLRYSEKYLLQEQLWRGLSCEASLWARSLGLQLAGRIGNAIAYNAAEVHHLEVHYDVLLLSATAVSH